jgi:hypothetical protein
MLVFVLDLLHWCSSLQALKQKPESRAARESPRVTIFRHVALNGISCDSRLHQWIGKFEDLIVAFSCDLIGIISTPSSLDLVAIVFPFIYSFIQRFWMVFRSCRFHLYRVTCIVCYMIYKTLVKWINRLHLLIRCLQGIINPRNLIHITNIHRIHVTNIHRIHITNIHRIHITNIHRIHVTNIHRIHVTNIHRIHVANIHRGSVHQSHLVRIAAKIRITSIVGNIHIITFGNGTNARWLQCLKWHGRLRRQTTRRQCGCVLVNDWIVE